MGRSKLFWFAWALLMVQAFAFCDERTVDREAPGPTLLPAFKRLETESSAKTHWELEYVYHKQTRPPLSNEDVANRLEKGIAQPKRSDFKSEQSFKWRVAEVELLKKNLPPLIALFRDDFHLVGKHLPKFMPVYADIPVGFSNYEGSVALIVSTASIGTSYNTLRFDAKARARETARVLLPSIRKIYERFENSDIQHFGMSAVYGSKDLSEKSASAEPEFVAVIVPRKSCARFASGEMTDDEVLASAAVFLSDRETRDLAKVSLIAK